MMAQVIMCDSDDGNAASFLITNLDTGDTASWCAGCLPVFAQQILEAFAPTETPGVEATTDGTGDTRGEAGGTSPVPAPSPGPKSEPAPPQPVEGVGGVPEAAPAANE